MLDEKRVWSFALSISILINIAVIAVASVYWLSYRYLPKPEEVVVVELLELPAEEAPASLEPEETQKVAELKPQTTPPEESIERPPQTIEEEISTSVESNKPQTQLPKPEIELPPAELTLARSSPSGAELLTKGEEIKIEEKLQKQSILSTEVIKSKIEEAGTSPLLARIAERTTQEVESTAGRNLLMGDVAPPTSDVEKKSPFTQRPFAIIVENAPAARPQSGLSQADIVYEIMAEGGITRFLAIFQSEDAEKIGPLRSARPYFVMKAAEHNAVLVHCGGSVEAYTYLQQLALDHIDEMKNFRAFWRSKDRNPPHNLYTSLTSLKEESNRLGYSKPALATYFPVSGNIKNITNETFPSARKIEIHYTGSYQVAFEYDPSKNIYLRRVNGETHIDALNGNPITARVVIVQVTKQAVKDEEGRLAINFVGKGKGWACFQGKLIPVTWSKQTLEGKTSYYLENGEKLVIPPGKIWIEVVDEKTKVVFQ